jgi:uncharacterized repeat protein (TIGR01451 family)
MSALKKLVSFCSLVPLLMFLSGTAAAQEEGALEVTTTVQKIVTVVTEDGEVRTEYVEADTVVPGERVQYTILFRNVGSQPAENVVITNPISESLIYVSGSALQDGLQVEFSVDGGQSFAAADALRVANNGSDRPATNADYTHVRWVMQTALAVGDQGFASFAADLE